MCVCCSQASENKQVKVQADDPIGFMQLLAKNDFDGGEVTTKPHTFSVNYTSVVYFCRFCDIVCKHIINSLIRQQSKLVTCVNHFNPFNLFRVYTMR